MNYITFRQRFGHLPVFSVGDIRKVEPTFHLDRLTDWLKHGYIKRIIKNYYVFSDLKTTEEALFFIANKIYEPSYISMESALSFYKFIPDQIFAITSVSSKKTTTFTTPPGTFTFKSVKLSAFFGYKLIKFNNSSFKIAEPEKAILDYLYLNTDLLVDDDFYEMRINDEEFKENIDLDKFKKYLSLFKNKTLERRVKKFLKFIYA
ncbi:MAG: hypothetical protein AAB373_03440 [Patescibacteria group bacterium]